MSQAIGPAAVCTCATMPPLFKDTRRICLILFATGLMLGACSQVPAAVSTPQTAAAGAASQAEATAYCRESGGSMETRYPFYGTTNNNPFQLAGSLDLCVFSADDGSRIFIALSTLYADTPTLAASAYHEGRRSPPTTRAGPTRRACTAASSAASSRSASSPTCRSSTRGG